MPRIEEIYPEYIRLDGGTQPRAKIDQKLCEEYGERMKAGDKFPPLDVFFDGKDYWLADGFHRLHASFHALPGKAIRCNVYEGTVEDAQWHSYGVNKTHGLRRSNPDKARAVQMALLHAKAEGMSNCQIAEHCGVSEFMIRKYRQASTTIISQSEKDGPATSIKSKSDSNDPATSIKSKSDDGSPSTSIESESLCEGERPWVSQKGRPRTGRDGRTIKTARIGEHKANRNGKRRVAVYSPAEARETIEQGQQVRFKSFVKLELPTNHVANCAYDLLRFLPFEYLQKVFQEIVRIHQERTKEEASQ